MRPMYLGLAFGLLLASAGGLMAVIAKRPHSDAPEVLRQPRHPITAEMWTRTGAMADSPAPTFSLTSTTGATHTLDGLTDGKPLFLYFIRYGCPCSIDSEPLFQRLYKHQNGAVNFLGITADQAAMWASDWQPPYPVAQDERKESMAAFKADRSVYSALIDKDGKIVRMWPGYSAAMLEEANALMAKLTDKPARPFDPLYAPKTMTSGCEL